MLDRIGVRGPRVWARLVDAARHVEVGAAASVRFAFPLAVGPRHRRADGAGRIDRAEPCERCCWRWPTRWRPAPRRRRGAQWLLGIPDPGPASAGASRSVIAARPLTSRACCRRWPARRGVRAGGDVGRPGLHGGSRGRRAPTHPADPRAAADPGLDAALESDPKLLAAALVAIVYAPALGDPEGAVTLSPDVVQRHDLGGRSMGREFAWMPAIERSGSGAPWHIAGSLMGLDLALARSALRRISADEMPPVPTINLNDELTLARTAVALQPRDFDDARTRPSPRPCRGASGCEARHRCAGRARAHR